MADDVVIEEGLVPPVEETPVEEVEETPDAEVQEEEVEEPEVEEEPEESEEEAEEEEVEEEEPAEKYQRPIFKEIKERFPTFFKEFPDMREVYFREAKYSTIFPTVEDAEEAVGKSVAFDEIDADLRKGSTKALIDALGKVDPDAVEKVADGFLPQIYNRSPDLYFKIISPIIEGFVQNLYREGERTNNDNLKYAAQYASQFGWGHTDIDKLGQRKQVDPVVEAERKKLEDQRVRIETERYTEAYKQVASRSQKLLLTEIARSVSTVDDEYKRTAAVRDIFEKVNEVLTQDERHIKLMNSLWSKANRSGFSPESRNRLVSTLLARAKGILPAISRDIMAQIDKPVKKVEKKQVEQKKIVGGQVKPNNSAPGQPESKGKVKYEEYRSDRQLLDALLDGKAKRT